MEGERLGRIRDEEFWSALHKAISPGHHPNRRPITPVLCHPRFSFPPSSRCPVLPKPFLTYVPARVPPPTPASPLRSSPETWHSYTRTRTCTFVVRTQQPVSPTFPSHDSTPPSPSRPPSPCVLRVHRGHVHLSSSLTGFITYPSAEHQQPAREYVNAPRCPSAHPPAAGLPRPSVRRAPARIVRATRSRTLSAAKPRFEDPHAPHLRAEPSSPASPPSPAFSFKYRIWGRRHSPDPAPPNMISLAHCAVCARCTQTEAPAPSPRPRKRKRKRKRKQIQTTHRFGVLPTSLHVHKRPQRHTRRNRQLSCYTVQSQRTRPGREIRVPPWERWEAERANRRVSRGFVRHSDGQPSLPLDSLAASREPQRGRHKGPFDN